MHFLILHLPLESLPLFINRFFKLLLLSLIFTVCLAQSSSKRVPGEYIVLLAPAQDSSVITNTLSVYGVKNVRHLSGQRFVVRLERDPGILKVENAIKTVKGILKVQANFIYRTQSGYLK